MKVKELKSIHESLVNGNRKQMVDQINEYGLYDFFSDYLDYINGIQANIGFYSDCVISYHRLMNR
jgi:hypothetical protein